MANSLSQIDLAFANRDMLPQISVVEYLPMRITDHASSLVVITQDIESPSKLWRLNPCWLMVVPVKSKCAAAMAEY